MISQHFEQLGQLSDVYVKQGAHPSLIARLEQQQSLILPNEHKQLLRWSNGIEAYGGYFRLFGVYTTEAIDSIIWNQADFWKFAWGDRGSGYWCFGETAWGDQYCYSYESMRAAEQNREVYFLDALSMTPEVLAASFAEFFEKEFLRSAKEPYDAMIRQAREKLGPLDVSSHLVYVPSVLLSGKEDINHVQKMNARAAMICNGDIALQLDDAPADATVKALKPYEDELHRTRLQLVWA